MTPVSWAALLAGSVIIATRAPFIFAPAATRGFYLRLLGTTRRIRLLSLAPLTLGTVLLLSAVGTTRAAGLVVGMFGVFLLALGVFGFLIFTRLFQIVVEAALEGMDELVLRLMGGLSVLVGVLFFYVGLAVLR